MNEASEVDGPEALKNAVTSLLVVAILIGAAVYCAAVFIDLSQYKYTVDHTEPTGQIDSVSVGDGEIEITVGQSVDRVNVINGSGDPQNSKNIVVGATTTTFGYETIRPGQYTYEVVAVSDNEPVGRVQVTVTAIVDNPWNTKPTA